MKYTSLVITTFFGFLWSRDWGISSISSGLLFVGRGFSSYNNTTRGFSSKGVNLSPYRVGLKLSNSLVIKILLLEVSRIYSNYTGSLFYSKGNTRLKGILEQEITSNFSIVTSDFSKISSTKFMFI